MSNVIILGDANNRGFCTIDLSRVLFMRKYLSGVEFLFDFNEKTFYNTDNNSDPMFDLITSELLSWAKNNDNKVITLEDYSQKCFCLINISRVCYTRTHETGIHIAFENNAGIYTKFDDSQSMSQHYRKILNEISRLTQECETK